MKPRLKRTLTRYEKGREKRGEERREEVEMGMERGSGVEWAVW